VFQQNTLAMYTYNLAIRCEVKHPKIAVHIIKAIYSKEISELSLDLVYTVADEIIKDALNDPQTKVLSIALQESPKPE
jgi:hypothetical protein